MYMHIWKYVYVNLAPTYTVLQISMHTKKKGRKGVGGRAREKLTLSVHPNPPQSWNVPGLNHQLWGLQGSQFLVWQSLQFLAHVKPQWNMQLHIFSSSENSNELEEKHINSLLTTIAKQPYDNKHIRSGSCFDM